MGRTIWLTRHDPTPAQAATLAAAGYPEIVVPDRFLDDRYVIPKYEDAKGLNFVEYYGIRPTDIVLIVGAPVAAFPVYAACRDAGVSCIAPEMTARNVLIDERGRQVNVTYVPSGGFYVYRNWDMKIEKLNV